MSSLRFLWWSEPCFLGTNNVGWKLFDMCLATIAHLIKCKSVVDLVITKLCIGFGNAPTAIMIHAARTAPGVLK